MKATLTALLLHALAAPTLAADSQCFGTTSHGHIEGSVALPVSGPNFSPYSRLGVSLGRTHVHAKVAEIVADAYAELARQTPDVHYVYGETGWPSGGRFKPHRSHQNGLSVDFFVPVRNGSGQSVPLPTDVGDRFGYDIEFDNQARWDDYRVDFAALAEHLYQLHRAAAARGLGIKQVIFDRPYLPQLFATPRGAWLQQHVTFMKARPWVRHDEHYHVDFAIPCKP
ncbi:penicillin-insensitive murein endopeptidase [Roseateles sp. BYS78W]|uniref:Penicillin-insensitive murein endopeptidase n=1 Tax=Pelomonas candidula TaxID=3299025 RepID=A0ABW7HKQ3_9BURK